MLQAGKATTSKVSSHTVRETLKATIFLILMNRKGNNECFPAKPVLFEVSAGEKVAHFCHEANGR